MVTALLQPFSCQLLLVGKLTATEQECRFPSQTVLWFRQITDACTRTTVEEVLISPSLEKSFCSLGYKCGVMLRGLLNEILVIFYLCA